MRIISVAGSGSGCGKTTVVCAILRAVPGLGAVKISPCEIRGKVEWGAGDGGKDTDRYLRSGAAKVARIVGPRGGVGEAWERIKGEFEGLPGVVIEGTQGVYLPGDSFKLFVAGAKVHKGKKSKNWELAAHSDAIVTVSYHYNSENSESLVTIHHKSRFKSRTGSFVRNKWIQNDDDLFNAIRTFLSIPLGG